MPAWLLSPWGRRLTMYAAFAIILLVALTWYGNRQYYKGRSEESEKMSEDLRKKTNESREAALKQIQSERDSIQQDRTQLAAERAQFQRDRQRIDAAFKERFGSIEALLKEDNQRVLTTTDDRLLDLTRALHLELRSGTPVPSRTP